MALASLTPIEIDEYLNTLAAPNIFESRCPSFSASPLILATPTPQITDTPSFANLFSASAPEVDSFERYLQADRHLSAFLRHTASLEQHQQQLRHQDHFHEEQQQQQQQQQQHQGGVPDVQDAFSHFPLDGSFEPLNLDLVVSEKEVVEEQPLQHHQHQHFEAAPEPSYQPVAVAVAVSPLAAAAAAGMEEDSEYEDADDSDDSENDSEEEEEEEEMADDDDEYRSTPAKRRANNKTAAAGAAPRNNNNKHKHNTRGVAITTTTNAGMDNTPQLLVVQAPSSNKTVPFDMANGRHITIPVTMMEKKAKLFFQYFEKTFHPSKADMSAMKLLRRKHQLRKSSQKGRREQKIKNESMVAELERLTTTTASDVLHIVRTCVSRHVPAGARAGLLAEVTAALQDHFRTADSA